MTPVGEVFDRFPRVVRDLARDLGKQVRFDVEGGEIELDRSILDEIGDPLVHLVRNATDHGIEPPGRAGAGREAGRGPHPALGQPRPEQRGDPGERRRPRHRPREDPGEGAGARAGRGRRPRPPATTCSCGCSSRPGFSTAAVGERRLRPRGRRGCGGDHRFGALGGTLEVRSEAGQGTTSCIRVPLTLAIVRALLASADGGALRGTARLCRETVEFDPRCGDRRARSRGAGGPGPGDPDGAPQGPGPRRRPRPAAAEARRVILEIGERRTRAGGGRAAWDSRTSWWSRSTRLAGCRRSSAGRRSSRTVRRR